MQQKKFATPLLPLIVTLLAACAGNAGPKSTANATPGTEVSRSSDAPSTNATTASPAVSDAGTQKLIGKAESAVEIAADDEAKLMLSEAKAAFNAGDNVGARRLARAAITRAESSANNRYMAQAKKELEKVRGYTNLNAQQYSQLRAAENAIVNNEGKPAYTLLRSLNSRLTRAAKEAARKSASEAGKQAEKTDGAADEQQTSANQ